MNKFFYFCTSSYHQLCRQGCKKAICWNSQMKRTLIAGYRGRKANGKYRDQGTMRNWFQQQSKMIQVDATYKLNWHGFPVLMIAYFFPGGCFYEVIAKKNFVHKECLSLFLSRVLGVAITIGSSFLCQLLGLLTAAAGSAYGYEMGFVFGQWGDSLMISVQMVIIVLQMLWYSRSHAYAAMFFALSSCATLAAVYHYIPITALMALQTCSVPIIFVSKGIQIVRNCKQNGTGQLSLITVVMQFGGCLARAYVILRELGIDWIVLMPCLVSAILNGLLVAQIVYYKNSKTAKRREKITRRLRKAKQKKHN
uniref:Solute carrier family 66 member 3 n=1 Tax=Ditylenchus dipsaci TaxID=166011 RepID=A0A915D1B5_9BILA